MKKYEYDLASDFVRYVDQYDIRKSRFGWNEKMKVVTDYIVDEPIVGANSVVIPSASKDIVPEILKDGSFVKKADPALHLHGSLAVHWIKMNYLVLFRTENFAYLTIHKKEHKP
jgi:hypothetical protein